MQSQQDWIEIIEHETLEREDRLTVLLGRDISFSTDGLRGYLLAKWEPVVFDAMLVAAAVEFADRATHRPAQGWNRRLAVRIPVHEVDRWQEANVLKCLKDAIGFLTGDDWTFEFVPRLKATHFPDQEVLHMPMHVQAVIPYSDGMDSRAVAGIEGTRLGDGLLRVRVGTRAKKACRRNGKIVPFTGVPYSVKLGSRAKESSARSRGFKFALISGVAAYLSSAPTIIVPESGQGAIGPALVTVAHAYPDYRNHPLFTMRMEKFLKALFGIDVKFDFPRLWKTKAETLKEFVDMDDGYDWWETKTCWYDNRGSSVHGKFRNCGICAACMLRRMSVYAAGLTEKPDAYVTVDLTANSLSEAVDPDFAHLNGAFASYGLAGVLSMQNLADLTAEAHQPEVNRHAALLAYALAKPRSECESGLTTLLVQHASEWTRFTYDLGADSFVNEWIGERP